MTTNWRKEIAKDFATRGESWDDVERVVFDVTCIKRDADYWGGADRIPEPGDIEACLDYDFDPGYGSTEGPSFTLWTAKRVYLPACYDGSEWVASVPRNPCDEATEHVGGG
jgi:hypothetical protein